MKNYLSLEFEGVTFWFKLDLNPLTNEYDPHIWLRHLVDPEEAVAAYFNISRKSFNEHHNRTEAYSEEYDLTIYYMQRRVRNKEIIVITAFRGK